MNKKFKIEQKKKELIYGCALFFLCAFAFIFIANRQHNEWESEIKSKFLIHAVFGRTDGLHVGDMVRISGINVGTVIKTELLNDYRVDVSMLLDKDFEIPDDSSASIEFDFITGDKFMDITLGGNDEIIPYNGNIIYTQDAMVIEELLDLVISYANSVKNPKKKTMTSTPDSKNISAINQEKDTSDRNRKVN